MTYIVKDECIKCKLTDCVEVCPVDCFYEGENMLVINPDECIDCGVCEPECPIDAIKADTDETVKNRMSKASDEISHYAEYDYIIINEDFDESLEKINSILIAEGLKRTRQNKIQDVIKSLRDDLF